MPDAKIIAITEATLEAHIRDFESYERSSFKYKRLLAISLLKYIGNETNQADLFSYLSIPLCFFRGHSCHFESSNNKAIVEYWDLLAQYLSLYVKKTDNPTAVVEKLDSLIQCRSTITPFPFYFERDDINLNLMDRLDCLIVGLSEGIITKEWPLHLYYYQTSVEQEDGYVFPEGIIKKIADAITSPLCRITELELTDINFTNEDMLYIVSGLKQNRQITSLDLASDKPSWNHPNCIEDILTELKKTALHTLKLRVYENLVVFTPLMNYLANNPGITYFYLGEVDFDQESMESLAKALRQNNQLETVYFNFPVFNNSLNVTNLATALSVNKSLRRVILKDVMVGASLEHFYQFIKAMESHTKLIEIDISYYDDNDYSADTEDLMPKIDECVDGIKNRNQEKSVSNKRERGTETEEEKLLKLRERVFQHDYGISHEQVAAVPVSLLFANDSQNLYGPSSLSQQVLVTDVDEEALTQPMSNDLSTPSTNSTLAIHAGLNCDVALSNTHEEKDEASVTNATDESSESGQFHSPPPKRVKRSHNSVSSEETVTLTF